MSEKEHFCREISITLCLAYGFTVYWDLALLDDSSDDYSGSKEKLRKSLKYYIRIDVLC